MFFPDSASPVHPSGSVGKRRKLAATQARRATGGKDDWCTPAVVLKRVRRVGEIGLDPCTSAANPAGAIAFLVGGKRNGLTESWAAARACTAELVYVNPPYSQIARWSSKIAEEALTGCEVVSLVAARPDSRWFYRLVWDSAQAVCFWKGRLRFVGAPSSAPFPSAVVYHGKRPWAFEAAFSDVGRVVRL